MYDRGLRTVATGAGGSPDLAALLDRLDVADLDSEHAHNYLLGDAEARFNVAHRGPAPDGREIADGGRKWREVESFEVALNSPSRMIMCAWSTTPLEVWADGVRIGQTTQVLATSEWMEHAIELPAAKQLVVRATRGRFSSYHYWWYRR